MPVFLAVASLVNGKGNGEEENNYVEHGKAKSKERKGNGGEEERLARHLQERCAHTACWQAGPWSCATKVKWEKEGGSPQQAVWCLRGDDHVYPPTNRS